MGPVRRCRRGSVVAVAVAALCVPPAAAQTPPENPTQGVSAIDQYVEAIPSAAGPRPTGSARGRPATLPTDVVASVRQRGGGDADALIEVATSPAYGAPARTPRDAEAAQPNETDSSDEATALGAAVAPVVDADEPRLLLLLGVLTVLTAAAAAAAIWRRRAPLE